MRDSINEKFIEFIHKHNIDIDSIYDALHIYSEKEINRIIANNKIEGETSIQLVSIADIIGYDYNWRGQSNNIADNFSIFFGEDSTYQTRSNGMLEYSSDEIIEKLYQSFKREPIRILELDNGRKVVSSNGMHRYTLLRLHYINELKKIKGDKEKEALLKRKYEIPVEITKVDLFKTYCQFIINMISQETVYISNHYDENYCKTGKVEISIEKEKIILSDEELLNYTKNLVRNIPKNMIDWFKYNINTCCENYDSFKSFINMNLREEISLLSEENNKKGRG